VTGRIGRWAIVLLTGSVLVACTAANGADGPPPSAPPGGAVITARDIKFDRGRLEVTAGRPFALLFDNLDSAPHNVRIYDGDVDQPLFVGDVLGGPGARAYDVPAIPAGTHRFRCDVHPEMAGTVTAR
jgi:plastocyanin